MRRLFLFLVAFICLFLQLGCLDEIDRDNREFLYQEDFNVEEFTSLELAGWFDVFYTQSPYTSLTIKARDPEHISSLSIELKNNNLLIYKEGTDSRRAGRTFTYNRVSIDTSVKYQIYVNAPNIESFQLFNSVNIYFDALVELEKLNIETAGSATIELPDISLGELTLETAGSITVNISGSANKLTVETAGSARVNGQDFICNIVNIETAGSSQINITVLDVLDVEIAGMGRVNYWGNPTIRQSIAGLGRIVKMETAN